MTKIAFLGVGNMAGAIIGGLARRDGMNIYLFDKNPGQYSQYEGRGYIFCDTAADAVAAADYIVFSVKPQNITELFGWLQGVPTDGKIFISIMAGVPIARIISLLGHDAAVVRTMPNAPMMIGKGVTALTRNQLVPDAAFDFVTSIFAALGQTLVIGEDQMNAVISVTSSAPAYVYLFIKAIYDSAAEQGFDPCAMLGLICSMVEGSAEMLRSSGKTPDEMIKVVASKGGTTEAALNVLNTRGFEDIINDAMTACTKRADELSKM